MQLDFDKTLRAVKTNCFPLTLTADIDILIFLKAYCAKEFPSVIKTLQIMDNEYTAPKRCKGYGLHKVKCKGGFKYYVRYISNGKWIRSRWCTNTDDLDEANEFAVRNRDKIMKEYGERQKYRVRSNSLYGVLSSYYKAGSDYINNDSSRGRVFGEERRRMSDNTINKQFIPFLQKEGITSFEEITTAVITDYQNYLLSQKKKSTTVNDKLSPISMIFRSLCGSGYIKDNPFNSVISLKPKKGEVQERGCYAVDKLKGIFNKRWNDKYLYLLNLVVYTTGLRNGELEGLRVKDIIKIGGIPFFDVIDSKSENGIRVVPIHSFVLKKIKEHIAAEKLTGEDILFTNEGKIPGHRIYFKAYTALGKKLGMSIQDLKKENITFYSARHFWKTLMNAEELGVDIEEVFMGHKVSKDVSKSYCHTDKQGQGRKLAKARKVFAILDKRVFGASKYLKNAT